MGTGSHDGADALVRAVRFGTAAGVRAVLAAGQNPDRPDPASGLTPLMFAAGLGDTDKIAALLAAGALTDALDRKAGTAALHKACQGAHTEAARLLIEAGASVDLQATSTGHTPLFEAIWFKADDIVALLLDRSCRLTPTTYYGFTLAEHLAYAKRVSQGAGDADKLARIEDLIAQRRARDAAAQDEAGLIRAVQAGDVTALRDVLAAGAAVDRRWPVVGGFDDGHTALLVAARDGHTDMVRLLIEAGADVNAVEPVFGAVPLHKATYNGHLDITRQLAAAKGVALDYQGPSNGYTPLHDALWHGFADCASVLVDAGARTDIVAWDGKRPLDLAREKLGPDHPLTKRLAGT
ncbi:ankyrin repeat domain-containing protein [Rhodoplanes sp. TEM]|uniref:Ankyrin repeat domain-containing protein n=1 Tax=Rhodoplanes tepidamans TaxID=200616 RepID=A0ABT5JAM6_RHOTP|nr:MULTISPECIES: ankyrin repeat domain-containing protein [Rhodoplanes]MDC7786623.1 ankyrin repeat domain-containing protein [Rhodoplanes tepidamans]MDC7983030.1 ankyrin repeat domain-containing protein [Rhodoplanes sp. TEM]MDQ0356412.1 ankyrin repeat protein [Rhodoplanes tepidamans]